ncbi:MAG: hypothetical protein KC561_01890, partial [Myxococcales bacterium]|nr:hypothetical protein [Myxococcales bacterium]
WGTDIRIRLEDTDLEFSIRLPKSLRTEDGNWGLAEPPELGGRLQMFVDMGFHLSPRLLAFEHYPMPYFSGNYWSYQIRTVERVDSTEETGRLHERDSELPRLRIEVESREDYGSYALVTLLYTYSDPSERPEREHLLLTPKRIFPCNRDCRRNINDLSWLLSHASSVVTPDLVFPLEPGMGWRRGGRSDPDGEYRTWTETEEVSVPAGHYTAAIRVVYPRTVGREHRFFVSGLGTVLRRVDGPLETTYYELIDYRIIP